MQKSYRNEIVLVVNTPFIEIVQKLDGSHIPTPTQLDGYVLRDDGRSPARKVRFKGQYHIVLADKYKGKKCWHIFRKTGQRGAHHRRIYHYVGSRAHQKAVLTEEQKTDMKWLTGLQDAGLLEEHDI